MRLGTTQILTAGLLALAACGYVPERVSWSDPRLSPMLDAVDAVDRASLGFSPIDPASPVRLESRPRAGYDAMLHIDGRTSRTIAFRKTDAGTTWIGEQEIYTGPNTYESVDGTLHEEIVISFETAPLSGHADGKVHVTYHGEDERLRPDQPLALEDVKPIIAEWDSAK